MLLVSGYQEANGTEQWQRQRKRIDPADSRKQAQAKACQHEAEDRDSHYASIKIAIFLDEIDKKPR